MGPLIERLRDVLRSRLHVDLKHVRSLYPWQVGPRLPEPYRPEDLPAGAGDYLAVANPRLIELRKRYANFDPEVTRGTIWNEDASELRTLDLRFFRGDNPYVFQQQTSYANELSYALTWYHGLAGRAAAILPVLTEDPLFGVYVEEVGGNAVSRDRLDSASEVRFLIDHAGLSANSRGILDIGAGYGRLPYRIGQVFPQLPCFATDAVPESTFLSEYYLRFRQSPAKVVPVDEVDDLLASQPIDIATNVHSFSECRPEAIDWWVRRLSAAGVRYLMVIPNQSVDGTCMTNAGEDMNAIFARRGYGLAVSQRRFDDPILVRWGVDPGLMSLFELA